MPEPSFGGRFIEVNAEELNDAGEVRMSAKNKNFVAAASPEAEADLDRMSLRKGTLLRLFVIWNARNVTYAGCLFPQTDA